MPLISTGALSARAFGFVGRGIVTLTTGSVQEIFATSLGSRSATITLADGNIVTGSYIHSNNNQGLRYRSITANNSTLVYGSQQVFSRGTCGGETIAVSLAEGNVVNGRQMSHAEDGTNSYVGNLNLYYKTLTLSYSNTLVWGSATASSTVQSGSWVDVPSTLVTKGSTVNMMTGHSHFVGGGSCGRMSYSNINHFIWYRSLTVS
jgi:hypothetical protein